MYEFKVGDDALITIDCREGGAATGATAVYEGEFPRSVAIGFNLDENIPDPVFFGIADYDFFMNGFVKFNDGPITEKYTEWKPGEPPPLYGLYVVVTNPRFALPDGSKIWGDECWWVPKREMAGHTLKEMQDRVAEEVERFDSLVHGPLSILTGKGG